MAYCLVLSLALRGLCSGVAGCPGCPWPLDPKSPEVLELVDEVIAKVQSHVDLSNCLFREEVYNATKQVVAGFAYVFTFRAAESECKRPNIKANIWDKPSGEKEIKFHMLH